jgi:hypothetical protein
MNDLYAPKAEDNPWRLDDMKTLEERLQISLWYPFSVPSLIFDGRWYENCRCSNRNDAYTIMKALAKSEASFLHCYIVVQFFRYGKEGREKAILFSPSENTIRAEMMKAKEDHRNH